MTDQEQTRDDSAALIEQVLHAAATATPLSIRGGDSKRSIGFNLPPDTGQVVRHAGTDAADAADLSQARHHAKAQADARTLSLLSHAGIISYEPTELVVSVRTGTRLETLVRVLDEAGQMLPFEPPQFAGSTIGGVIACGLSGPARPFSGSARDYVLGTRIINGQGQKLSFGGEVMKNVAGYDVSRLQVGAWGTLGVLLDVSMKVLPKPEVEATLVQESTAHDTQGFSRLLRLPVPLSGAMLIGDRRYLRLSGSASAVQAAARTLGGEAVNEVEAGIWSSVRDQRHAFFTSETDHRTLWRISVANHAPALPLAGDWLYDWAGAQRWLLTEQPATVIFEAARAAGGHATRFGESPSGEPAFQPLQGAMLRLQARVRDSFDPDRLFNRGRFHPELDLTNREPESLSA